MLETIRAAADLAPAQGEPSPVGIFLSRNPRSRSAYAAALARAAAILAPGVPVPAIPWERLRAEHLDALAGQLAERFSPATANQTLAAVRGVLRAAWRAGQLGDEDFRRALDTRGTVRGERVPAGRALSDGEIRALARACGRTPGGRRDAALLGLLYGCGLRRAEAVALDLDDLDLDRGTLTVRGKGNRERVAFLPPGVPEALAAWLAFRGDDPGPLLCPVAKDGAVELRRLTPQSVLLALRRLAARAGVQRFSPHDLRRTYVGDLLDAGVDLATVQASAGHASPLTTARYDRRGERAKAGAASRLRFPFAA